jgi:hypothetical protein
VQVVIRAASGALGQFRTGLLRRVHSSDSLPLRVSQIRWKPAEGTILESCTILTTTPNAEALGCILPVGRKLKTEILACVFLSADFRRVVDREK